MLKEVWGIFGDVFKEFSDYLLELIEKNRFFKAELGVYKDPIKVRGLSDEDLEWIYKELKKVYKHY